VKFAIIVFVNIGKVPALSYKKMVFLFIYQATNSLPLNIVKCLYLRCEI
jgi:hypothetical protein